MDSKAKLSVVIITKNEERNIKQCLESVKWADEIIVVDAESVDRTVEIAKQYTDKVFIKPWSGFGPQKNWGISKAKYNWIFIIDADERVTPELKEEILAAIDNSNNVCAFQIPRKNYFLGKWFKYKGEYPNYQLRLFKKGKAWYNDVQIHENLIVKGKIGYLKEPLLHFPINSIEDYFIRFNQYTTLAAIEKNKRRKSRVRIWDLIFRPMATFIKMYIIKQGFRHGKSGFIFSILDSFFTYVKYLKLCDIQEGRLLFNEDFNSRHPFSR
ncbi:MAG: glycosyltransferase family 2 protein [Candidatus Helarchaeota archaeon]